MVVPTVKLPHHAARPARRARLGPARVVAARPLLWFFVLAYALIWAWWLPLALAGQTVTEGDGWPTHFPGLLGPALAALLVTAAQGPSGVGALLRRMGRWRIGLLGWLLAASPLALGAITVLVVGLTGQGWPQAAELGRYSGLPSSPSLPSGRWWWSPTAGGRRPAGAATPNSSSSAATVPWWLH
jgi:hypothetical protein